ncbi:NADH-quinone oxidoreductase subunit G [Amycolatopsis sp. M39]|nr:NADH-quinone oxidoreductase subunit G [Amycolatopsis sp. M39]OAP26337.1 NADH-quinone oxidoreductase subunit 3 [Amycolatopsis sp. M39]
MTSVTVSIDGAEVTVPEGTLLIRATESAGAEVPRFCDHPLLTPVGACRQCLVEVEGLPKPVTACTTEVAPGMIVRTQATSPVAEKAQRGVLELLLINHPLDCPVCDKGGECPLQNQAMAGGRDTSRFTGPKRTFAKPVPLSRAVLLDRERCVQCARCTRFADQIAGDPLIGLLERGAAQQIGTGTGAAFDSYFSGNTVQICPVGALTSVAYRFRARPFDLESTRTVCEHCASGCATRTDTRRGKVLRRLAGEDPEVNDEWMCDKGRWAFRYATVTDRLTYPRVREALTGKLTAVAWPLAFRVAARALAAVRGHAGVLTGGRLTVEDAYAYGRFARVVLGTNDVDFRARPVSAEETEFLTWLAGRPSATYADVGSASTVVLAGLEPEEESPILFLRLRKAVRTAGTKVYSVAPFTTRGLVKLSGTLLRAAPGEEPAALDELVAGPGAVVLAGERLATVPGGLSAVVRLAERTGALLGWVPRRAGERGALAAGAFPTLLPGARPVADAAARADAARLWQVAELPAEPGRDVAAMLAGDLRGLLAGGVELDDLPDPRAARQAVARMPVVVSLEQRPSALSELATVVFPVATVAEKAGTFHNWENRPRTFEAALRSAGAQPDLRVLAGIAEELDVLAPRDGSAVRAELAALGAWPGRAGPPPAAPPAVHALPRPRAGEAVLATWRPLLDGGRLQDGEEHLAGTARTPLLHLSAATADEFGIQPGDPVTVSTDRGAITLPTTTADLPDRVVWLPQRSAGSAVHAELGVTSGAVVRLSRSSG